LELYLFKNNQQLGPYTEEQLQAFLKQELVTADDLIWANEWPSWVPIRNVPDVVPSPPSGQVIRSYPVAKQMPPQAPQVLPSSMPSTDPIALKKDEEISKAPSKDQPLTISDCFSFLVVGIVIFGFVWLVNSIVPPQYLRGISLFFRLLSHLRL
jgi:hypothetical protein